MHLPGCMAETFCNLHIFEAFWGRANHFANDAHMHSGPFVAVPNDLRLTVWEFNGHRFAISPGNLQGIARG